MIYLIYRRSQYLFIQLAIVQLYNVRVFSFQASDLNSKLKEDKSSSALKKKPQMNKTGGKTPAASTRTTVPPSTKKQPLKPQHSAPARTSSLKTKKEANSDSSPSKSSGLEQKRVKPDTIAAHKNPTR